MESKKRLFVDMDGTLAEFVPVDTLEKLYEKNYFANLAPQNTVIDAVKDILVKRPDVEVFVMSSVLTDSKFALQEKNEWLDRYLPEIDTEHRIFPPCGQDKKLFVPGQIQETDFLFDDYTHNLLNWEPPARGIKILNGINHTRETWAKDRLSFLKEPEVLADNILSIMDGTGHFHDPKPVIQKESAAEKGNFRYSLSDGSRTEFHQHEAQMKETLLNLSQSYVRNPKLIAEFFAFSSSFYQYSVRNNMLIFAQNPNAMFVQSYPAWKKMGANVLRGQKGIKIMVPVDKTFLKLGKDKVIPLSEADRKTVAAFKKGEIESFTKKFFKTGNVFDISQTDFPKERYPQLFHMGYDSEYHSRLFDALSEFAATTLSCPVQIEDMQSISLRGKYIPGANEIHINHLLNDTQRLSTLAHETGHAMIHHTPDGKSPAQIEFEGDCVGIMLESRFGIMPTDIRKDHLAQHFSVLKNELAVNTSLTVPAQLDKIISNVYDIYNKNILALDDIVKSYVPTEEIMQHRNALERPGNNKEISNSCELETSMSPEGDFCL